MTGWESLGGLTTGEISAVSWGPGRLDVFVRGTDNIIYHKWYEGSWGPSMTDWESLGGWTDSDVSVVSVGVGKLDLFVRGAAGAIYHKWFNGTRGTFRNGLAANWRDGGTGRNGGFFGRRSAQRCLSRAKTT